MTDNEFTLFIFLGIFMALCAFQQLRIVRLRRKIERIAEGVSHTDVALTPSTRHAASASRPADYDELRKRVRVLERIATDGNSSLDRELEELRGAG